MGEIVELKKQKDTASSSMKILLLLSFGHLVTDLAQGALPAILPILKDTYNISYTVMGLIPLLANISSSVIQPLFGIISDKRNCLWFLPIGCLVTTLGIGLLGYANNYIIIILLVILSGLGSATYHPEGAKVAHYAANGKRASSMSIFSVGGNFGFALGVILMALLLAKGGLPFTIFMVVPGIIMSALLWLKLKDLPRQTLKATNEKRSSEPISKKSMLTLINLLAIVMIRSWVQAGLNIYIPFYYINHLNADQLEANSVLFIFLLAGAVGTVIGGPISDQFGRKKIIVGSMLLLPALILTFINTSGSIALISLAIAGAVMVSTFSTTVVLGQELLPNNVGIASGLTMGFAVGTGGLGVFLLGILADNTSEHFAMLTIALLPLIGVILGMFLPKEKLAN